MLPPNTFKTARALALTLFMVVVWLVLGMVYVERFFPPFGRLVPWLMPWKGLNTIPLEAGLDQRLVIMQNLLAASNRVAQYALAGMILSFAALSMYLSVLYQQKQRRVRENLFLALKNREIARRNEFIRYISATISHEFKNNLGRIKRRLDLFTGLPADSRDRISDNFEKLFADIEIFKKISDEREAGLVEFKNVDLRAMLNDLAAHYSDLAEITVNESAAIPLIYAASPLLKTVFENVLDNAVKYKKPDQPRARVHVSCALDQDAGRRYVTVSLRDEGIGMDEQQADTCFYRGKGAGENWGQGLYFAKYVIGLHAGRIRVGMEHTALGQGLEIIIHLPFVEETLDV